MLYEDSDGNGTPEENGNWTKALSEVIKHNKSDANLLVHVHHRFGYAQSSVMKVGFARINVMFGPSVPWAHQKKYCILTHPNKGTEISLLVMLVNKFMVKWQSHF